MLQDDTTYNRSNQNVNKVQDKDNDIQESAQGSKKESNNKSIIKEANPNKPEDNRNPVLKKLKGTARR